MKACVPASNYLIDRAVLPDRVIINNIIRVAGVYLPDHEV